MKLDSTGEKRLQGKRQEKEQEKIKEKEINEKEIVKNTISKKSAQINFDDFLTCWNSELSPKISKINKSRKEKIKIRIDEDPDFLFHFKEVIKKIKKSKFLSGGGKHNWSADFDWVIGNDTNYIATIEGKYDDAINKVRPGFSEEELRETARRLMRASSY